ncbi:MAG: NPCBM/NEW2 domain-containing protein [Candidatus Hydrogenedentes bacterium]|nr:NPCBM/NEW2 domain-containing protein [Candidatus Hydrogenedentota bacterium]
MPTWLFRNGLAAFLIGICAAAERTPAITPKIVPEDESGILSHVVHHTQGWGNMGVNACAYQAGVEPQPLRIGEVTYATGLGLHAPGETWLALEGHFSVFEAEVGVQKQASNQGSVEFKVYADGTEVFTSGIMRESDPAKPVRLAVDGVRFLKLEFTDAGDGITCDCANWVNLRLTPASGASNAASLVYEPLDIAPFARVLGWNPYRKDGTHATRTEEFVARDLYLGTAVARGDDGTYAIPVIRDPFSGAGFGCIGLEWLEQRRVRMAEIHFDGAAPDPAGASVELWAMTPDMLGTSGVSQWQGHWERVMAEIQRKDNSWSIEIPPTPGTWRRPKTLKLRWITPPSMSGHRVQKFSAYTDTDWREAEIVLRALQPAANAQATVSIYNGAFRDGDDGGLQRTWSLAEPLPLRLRYAARHPWTLSECTVLRISTPTHAFGIGVEDVLKSGHLFVEDAQIVAVVAERADTIDAEIAALASKKTVLEEVREMPDQTFASALDRLHRREADFGPTLLSLANGNEKFLVQRSGAIGFYAPGDVKRKEMPRRSISPSWEGQSEDTTQRHLEGGWMPIPVVSHTQGAVTVQQRSFVAPLGETNAADRAWWYNDQPLCVAEYTFTNSGHAAAFEMTWTCAAESDVTLRAHGRGVTMESGGQFAALLDTGGATGLQPRIDGSRMILSGQIPANGSATCVLLIPGWAATPEALPAADRVTVLLEATKAHWQQAMKGSARISVPDPMLTNLIAASRVHCMLAARNEDGNSIAPWIASTYYGPLESEAHSIIRGMEFMGHDDFARRGLAYFVQQYNERGYLTTGYTLIGTGWHLWALGEYYALHKDKEWLSGVAPEVSRVCRWIMAQRKKTMQVTDATQRPPDYGLMPPGVLADWSVYSHYFYLNGNYYAGLRSAGEALAEIGWEGADEICSNAANFRGDIDRAFRYVQAQAPVLPLRDGTWALPYPTQLYAPIPTGELYADGDDMGRTWAYDVELGSHHLVPMGVLDATDPSVTAMMNHMEDVQFLNSGWNYYPEADNRADWFNFGGFAKVQPFYARNAEVYAARDDVKPFIRSYFNATASLLNREDLSLWEHFFNGAFNKTHETGYFLYQSRLMLIMERERSLWLAPFAPAQWLEDGKTIDVQDAPTLFGTTGFTIVSHVNDGYIAATINPPARQAPDAIVIRLRHPGGIPIQRVEVNGAKSHSVTPEDSTIHLVPGGKAITIRAYYGAAK